MKKKTTMKNIKANYKKVFYCGYCDLQHIMRLEEAQYYNAGVYGWNCDIYTDNEKGIAITTGYRNMIGNRIPDELIKKYEDNAKKILEHPFAKSFDEKKKELDDNKENFFKELNNL